MAMTREDQETLTRVGPGTPMGRLLRHYWFPVAVSSELPPGTARPARLLGEDLVVFRTTEGALGLVDAACPHRGADLSQGIVEADGLRCPYHGWLFGSDGRCLAMPAERDVDPAAIPADCAAGAHAVAELGGLVFGHIGAGPAPVLPRYDLFTWDGVLRDVGRALLPCNWLQIMENSVDPTHVEWLHGRHLGAVRARDGRSAPDRYRRRHARIGFDRFEHGIVKRRVLQGGSEADDDWSVGHPLVFPVMLRVGTDLQHRFQIRVPVDDTHTLHYWYACYRPPAGVTAPEQDGVPVYEVPWRDERGGFITDFVDGGDIMTWVGQGPVADRTKEHLVGSDQGIVLLRRMLFEQLERVAQGLDPLGVVRDPAADVVIDLPQESRKYGDGRALLREAIELSHVRHSPLVPILREWMEREPSAAGG